MSDQQNTIEPSTPGPLPKHILKEMAESEGRMHNTITIATLLHHNTMLRIERDYGFRFENVVVNHDGTLTPKDA